VLIIAHRLSAVREANRIIVMERGQIAEQGSHAELLGIGDGIYRHLYNLQSGNVEAASNERALMTSLAAVQTTGAAAK
jgi:subfamily B ATP-binding cassette protein HlyB/CyaB